MSDQKEYTNGHGREPNKMKPDIGRDDVEDLIDFGDSDDEEIEDDAEEEPVSDEMQVVLEAAHLLPQDYNSDEIEEVPGDLPEVLYEFDPENQGVAENQQDAEEQIVEQQVLDVAGVLIEMVEERSENQLIAEGQVQIEIACDEAQQESPPQSVMGLGNPSNQGLEDPTGGEPSSAALVTERLVQFASDSSEIDQNGDPEGPGPNGQGLGAESSGQGSNNQDGNNGSPSLGQGANVQDMSDEPSRSGQGLKEEQLESGHGPSGQVQNGMPLISDQGMNNEALIRDPSRSSQDPVVDRNLNERSAISVQGLQEGPSASGQELVDQDTGEKSDQGALVQNLNEPSRSSHECNTESSCIIRVPNDENLNGGPSRSDKDPIEQQIREDVGACEEVMEQLEVQEDEVDVNVQAQPIQNVEMERQPNPEQDIGLRNQMAVAAGVVEQDIGLRDQIMEADADLNGGPHSGPNPGEQRDRVGQVAANEEVVAPLEAAVHGRPVDHIEEAPDQNEDVLLDEQDNLVEEQAEGVQILPGPLEVEIGRLDNVAAEEPDIAAEAQKTE